METKFYIAHSLEKYRDLSSVFIIFSFSSFGLCLQKLTDKKYPKEVKNWTFLNARQKKCSLEEHHVLNLKISFMFFKTSNETIIFESFKSFRSHLW